jgi:hypothetical protein
MLRETIFVQQMGPEINMLLLTVPIFVCVKHGRHIPPKLMSIFIKKHHEPNNYEIDYSVKSVYRSCVAFRPSLFKEATIRLHERSS